MGIDNYVPVKGHPHLVRDTESNAIINTNSVAISQGIARKKHRQLKEHEEMTQKNRLDSLEKDISEIKHSLELLLSIMHK